MSSREPTDSTPTERRLTRTYRACLVAVGSLGFLSGVHVLVSTSHIADAGMRINVTGRQRMLAQRVTAAAHGMALTMPGAGEELRASTAAFHKGWSALGTGDSAQGLVPPSAPERVQLASLERQIADFDVVVTAVQSGTRDSSARRDVLRQLADARTALVSALDRVVQRLAQTQHAQVASMRRVEFLLAVLFGLVVVMLSRFVIRPVVRSVTEVIEAEQRRTAAVEHHAAEMTRSTRTLTEQNDLLQKQLHSLMREHDTLLNDSESLRRNQRVANAERAEMESHSRTLARFAMTLDAAPDIVVMVGLDGEVLYQNTAATAALPALHRHRGLGLLRLFAKESARTVRAEAIPLVLEHGIWQGELSMRSDDSEQFALDVTLMAQRDQYNYPEVFVVLAHDLRAERRLRDSLAERDALHRAVIDSLAEGVIVQDRNGRVVAWNESATRMLAISGEELAERAPDDLAWAAATIEGSPVSATEHPITRARVESERVDGFLMRVERGNGTVRELSVNARPMYTSDFDDRPGAVATFTDVSSQRALMREMETLSVVVRQSDYAVMMTDAASCITWVNSAFEQMTGFAMLDVIDKTPGPLLLGVHTAPETAARLRSAMHGGQGFHDEILTYRRDGTPHWVELTLTPLHDSMNAVSGFVGLSRDVTARRAAERERTTLAAALAVAADGVAIIDAAGTLEFVNHAFARQQGHSAEELLGRTWISLYADTSAQSLTQAVRSDVTSLGFWHGEVIGRRASAEPFPQEISLTLLPQGGLVAVVRDISDRKAAEDRLKFLSTRDELTGLLNRRGFMTQASEAVRDAHARGRSCALLYGDLDSFKLINDRFGHPTGDLALQEISRLLGATFRSSDLLARLGGDEFTVLVCDVGRDEIDRVLERLNQSVAAHNAARAHDPESAWTLGVSLGVAFAEPGVMVDIDSLLRDADSAQYVRKSQRKAVKRVAA